MSGCKPNASYNLDGSIPRARQEAILCNRVPAHGKGLALVLAKVHDRKVAGGQVEQLQRAVAASDHELVLVDLGPGEVVEGIVGVECLLDLDAGGAKAEHEEATITDDSVVSGGRDSKARVVVRRVLDGIRVEARGAEFEHGRHGWLSVCLSVCLVGWSVVRWATYLGRELLRSARTRLGQLDGGD